MGQHFKVLLQNLIMILVKKFWAKLLWTQDRQAKKIFYMSKNQQTKALKSTLEIRNRPFS